MRIFIKKCTLPLIALGLMTGVGFAVGVNSGYGKGADDMQCVVYHLLASGEPQLVKQELADDACVASNSWSEWSPTVMVRKVWVLATDPTRPNERPGD